jgi:acyl-coenzyme A thioesterase PaaI-like protein
MRQDRESAVSPAAFQDLLAHNHCFGCGPDNPNGLHLKSYWSGEELSVASFTPDPYHCAGPKHFVNGGILATLIDCHCVCTAAAMAYRDAGREPGSDPDLHYATARLTLEYIRPAPIGVRLELRARIVERRERIYVVSCELSARGEACVSASVDAIAVPSSWVAGDRAPN